MAARNKSKVCEYDIHCSTLLLIQSFVKATEAIASLESEGLGSGRVLWHHLDLSDPRNAKKSADEFLKKETRLDILSACIKVYQI